MNKIEELEHRIENLEELLNVQASLIQETRKFWSTETYENDLPQKVAYKCNKAHFHDSIKDAKECNEKS